MHMTVSPPMLDGKGERGATLDNVATRQVNLATIWTLLVQARVTTMSNLWAYKQRGEVLVLILGVGVSITGAKAGVGAGAGVTGVGATRVTIIIKHRLTRLIFYAEGHSQLLGL